MGWWGLTQRGGSVVSARLVRVGASVQQQCDDAGGKVPTKQKQDMSKAKLESNTHEHHHDWDNYMVSPQGTRMRTCENRQKKSKSVTVTQMCRSRHPHTWRAPTLRPISAPWHRRWTGSRLGRRQRSAAVQQPNYAPDWA